MCLCAAVCVCARGCVCASVRALASVVCTRGCACACARTRVCVGVCWFVCHVLINVFASVPIYRLCVFLIVSISVLVNMRMSVFVNVV